MNLFKLIFAAAVLGGVSGCVTDEPRKADIPPQPDNARPTTVQVVAGNPRDTNGNGYIDSVGVTVFLWDEMRSPIPLALPGQFVFELKKTDGTDLGKWEFDETRTAAAMVRRSAGPAYIFDLSILGQASDKVDSQQVDLGATFRPKSGEVVRSAAGTGLRFGKTGT